MNHLSSTSYGVRASSTHGRPAARRGSWVARALTSDASLTWAASLILAVLLGLAATASAAPEDPATPPKEGSGPTFENPSAGVRATGPAGWRMKEEKGGVVEWSRLVTFFDPDSDADAVLSARKRTSADTQALLGKVREEWRGAKDFTVRATRKIDPSPQQPVGSVIVDASFTVRPKAKSGANPGIRPPPIPYRVQATYYLAPDAEYLLYVKAKQTFWSRVAPGLRAMEDSLKFRQPAAGATMQPLSFLDEGRGFRCTYPASYGVVLPAERAGIVEFRGLSEADPAIAVYRLTYDKEVDADARRLQAYYESEQGGEVQSKAIIFGGKDAVEMEIRANVGGMDQLILMLIVKRNDDTLFRLKCSMHVDREAEGRSLFKSFTESFKLITPKRG